MMIGCIHLCRLKRKIGCTGDASLRIVSFTFVLRLDIFRKICYTEIAVLGCAAYKI